MNGIDWDNITDEERRKNAESRKKLREENGKKYAGLSAYMVQCRKDALELMRRRHAYYTKLITDTGIKTAQDFYNRFKEQFLMYCIKLEALRQ